MLVPLTQSLYAPGKLGDTGKVLIDIGTGYFVEARARGPCAQRASTAVLTRRALCSTRPRTAWHTAAAKCCCCARTWTSWGRCAPNSSSALRVPTRAAQIITVKRRQLMQVQDVLQRKMASSQGARRA